jgi:hypothetical protein
MPNIELNPNKTYMIGHFLISFYTGGPEVYIYIRGKEKHICTNSCKAIRRGSCHGKSLGGGKSICGWEYYCDHEHNVMVFRHSKNCPLCQVDERE